MEKLSVEFFDTLEDREFYGPRVQHVYFYSEVDDMTVKHFQEQLQFCQKSISSMGVEERPKPIVIHLNSPGGASDYGITMMNILREIRVPFAVIVDGYACSAATPMLVAAPYRVMNEGSLVLIHEGSMQVGGKTADVEYFMKYSRDHISKMYTDTYTPSGRVK